MSTTVKRPLRWIAYAFGLLLVLIVPLVYFLSSTTPEMEDPLVIGTLWSISFVLLFIILIVQVVAPFVVESSIFTTAYTALFILLTACFGLSADCLYGIFGSDPDQRLIYVFFELSFFAFLSTMFGFERAYYFPGFKKTPILAYSAVMVLIPGIASIFGGVVAFSGFIIGLILYLVPFSASVYFLAKKDKDDATFFLTTILFLSAIGIGLFESFQHCLGLRGGLSLELIYLYIIVVAFAAIFLVNYVIVEQRRVEEGKKARHYQSEALLFEINPHMVYNALAVIKGKYRASIEEGDGAIDSFAGYLRGSLSIGREKMVPLGKELDNLSTYVEFMSKATGFKGNIVFDIDTMEGEIPPLSLQPFVENVFKHAGIADREDGLLIISTRMNEEGTIIVIEDNGNGFDMEKAKSGQGIRNVLSRAALLLGEAPSICSELGKGTRITFVLKKENHAENHRGR